MNLFTSLDISSSGLMAQRYRMNLISSNIANATTTRTADGGGPYRRQDAILAPVAVQQPPFDELLRSFGARPVNKVEVIGTFTDPRQPNLVYDPSHPDADADGIVAMPNINPIEEMANLLTTVRAYEANLVAVSATKDMIKNTLKI
ncbi:MAG: flagellar basal body rod protein FlgC [bacterium]|nr:flagellar basal body rod protein FlgC [bacterium]